MNIVRKEFSATGTVCQSCDETIKRAAKKIDGVTEAHFDHRKEKGYVLYDSDKTSWKDISAAIEEKGYLCSDIVNKKSNNTLFATLAVIVGVMIIGYFIFSFAEGINMPTISQNMGYGLLFAVGLLTGLHCIAMCGGFVIGYTTKDAAEGKKSYFSHLLYGTGKTVSYTIIGAAFGLLGSIIAFTPTIRGVIGIIAGIFLLLYGLKMLNILPFMRYFRIPAPKLGTNNRSPLYVGLANGLMIACGPLQAIYVMAAGTGSMIEGAKMLFIFALGTLPAMLGFGVFASYVSNKLTQKILRLSGAVVIVLGLVMLNNGLVLMGTGYDFGSITSKAPTAELQGPPVTTTNGYQEIHMTVDSSGFTPNSFVLQKGVQVHWIIDGKVLTSCNRAIQVPAYNLQFDVQQGLQTIDFTPTNAGTIPWSCYMGMIHGQFIVKDTVSASDTQQNAQPVRQTLTTGSTGMTCGMKASGGGGCGCGMMR